ncbi:MAG: hypothetical protein JNK54_09070 [Elusimicrobia bacterium]|jgi:hypothetical protein|nr:hypothetical protein [Elusimicrobiota bacterium]
MNTGRSLKATNLGFMAVCLLAGGAVSAKTKDAEKLTNPPIVSETVFFKDVSGYFYGQLPFLKKGYRFLDASSSVGFKEGAVSSLKVEPAKEQMKDSAPDFQNTKAIHTTADFSPFVDKIKTEEEAVRYVLFLSRKGFPWMEPIRFDYFQDVPFIASEFIKISSTTATAYALRPPRVVIEKGNIFQKKKFIITRSVIPLDQPGLTEKKILAGTDPLVLTEVGEITETLTEEGTYSFSLRRIPVKNLPIPNPLISLRKAQ